MKKKNYFPWFTIFLITVALAGMAILQVQLNFYGRKQAYSQLSNTAIWQANTLDSLLEGEMTGLISLSKGITSSGSIDLERALKSTSLIYDDRNEFDVYLALEDGIAYSQSKSSYDVSNTFYYQEGMQGESAISIATNASATPSMILYTPLICNGKPNGVLFSFIQENYFFKKMIPSMYDGSSITLITDSEGSLIMCDIDHADIANELSNSFLQNENSFENPTFDYHINEVFYYVSCTSLRMNDWYLVNAVPASNVQKEVLSSLIPMFSIILILLVFFGISFVISMRYAKESIHSLRREKLEIEKEFNNANIQKKELSLSLGTIFSSLYRIDLKSQTITPLQSHMERVKEFIASSERLWDNISCKTFSEFFAKELVHPDDVLSFRNFFCTEHFQKIGSMKLQYEEFTFRILCEDGTYHWNRSVLFFPDIEEDNTYIAILANRDIHRQHETELQNRKAFEDAYRVANQANEAKTLFISNMSHDIRTPMNAIIGMVAIATANIENKQRVLDCLNKIILSSKHLLSLINEVLDMSHIESGKIVISKEKSELSDILEVVSSIILPKVEQKQQHFSIHFENVIHNDFYGDSTRLQDILINLLSNAVKYTPNEGNISLTICEHSNMSNCSYYNFIINDDGIGMSKEFQEKAFEPFVRADNSKTSVQGSGLGLTITQNLVQLLNGTLTLESELNQGSTFTVSIPLKIQTEVEKNLEVLAGLKLLIVNDEPRDCEAIQHLTENLKLRTDFATSAIAALALLKKNQDYFAVFIDYRLPQENGLEVAKQIREHGYHSLPLILTATYDCGNLEKDSARVNIEAILYKPLFRSKFTQTLNAIMGNVESSSSDKAFDSETLALLKEKKILVVDDNEINLEIAMEWLRMFGIEADSATDGKVAVQTVTGHPADYYDLIFMDIQMPVMNGYEATVAIRQYAGQSPIIIALTANAYSSDVKASLDAGMNDHLSKPMELKQLEQCLKTWLLKQNL